MGIGENTCLKCLPARVVRLVNFKAPKTKLEVIFSEDG